jgi:TetR/AcrR family transcriptional repressor of nem operon
MGIGRQSMYDTFGDKRGLFLAALERYIADNVGEFIRDMEAGHTAIKDVRICAQHLLPAPNRLADRIRI